MPALRNTGTAKNFAFPLDKHLTWCEYIRKDKIYVDDYQFTSGEKEMSRKPLPGEMSRRERQIMDIVYRRGEASAADVASELLDRPGYSTVRKLMSILEGKGYLYHDREENNRYIYHPTIPAEQASESALANIMDTFFQGSAGRATIALLKKSESDISEEEKEMIISLIEASRQRGS